MNFLKYYLLIFIIFLEISCVNELFIGISSSYSGHYRSQEPVLDKDNYLYIRVSGGGFTIYFGNTTNGSNIVGLDYYENISPYKITGYAKNIYYFETGNFIGTLTFNQNINASIGLSKISPPTFDVENVTLDKINSF